MFVLEFKAKGNKTQYRAMDEAIRTVQFIRNKSVRYWEDNHGVNKYDLNKNCAKLAKEFSWAGKLNSSARQSAAERAWAAISRFYSNCKKQVSGKKPGAQVRMLNSEVSLRGFQGAEVVPHTAPSECKKHSRGYPKYQNNNRSVEYKKSGWKLDLNTRKHITFTDKQKIGRIKLVGTRDLHFYSPDEIQRVRIVRRADGYYVQFLINTKVKEEMEPSGNAVGLDVGIESFYTDSNGYQEPNLNFLRKGEQKLKKLQRSLSRKEKGSNNRKKARQKLAKHHLKISRQRLEHAKRIARCVCQSNDLIAYENLQIQNLVKNHNLAKSINDIAWYQFRVWLDDFAWKFGKITIAVNPKYTSQKCSNCGSIVQKSLSTRTHQCHCGTCLDRDENAAINILREALRTFGQKETANLELENAFGDLTATLVGQIQSKQVES